MRYAPLILIAVCSTFTVPALFSQRSPRAKGPIEEPIEKGDIVVGVVDRFRLPKTTDAIVEGATTHAYARIQYLNPSVIDRVDWLSTICEALCTSPMRMANPRSFIWITATIHFPSMHP